MTTINVSGFIYLTKAEIWETAMPEALAGMTPTWVTYDPTGQNEILLVIPHTLTIELPDEFDPRPAQVAKLQKEQVAADAAHHALTVEISRQINELQALEFTPAAIDALQTEAVAS